MYNKVTVTVAGKAIPLQTTEQPDYIKSIAKRLDDKLEALMQENPALTINVALILAALDFSDNLTQTTRNLENIRVQMSDYVEAEAKSRIALDKLKIENESLQHELTRMKADIELNNLKNKC